MVLIDQKGPSSNSLKAYPVTRSSGITSVISSGFTGFCKPSGTCVPWLGGNRSAVCGTSLSNCEELFRCAFSLARWAANTFAFNFRVFAASVLMSSWPLNDPQTIESMTEQKNSLNSLLWANACTAVGSKFPNRSACMCKTPLPCTS